MENAFNHFLQAQPQYLLATIFFVAFFESLAVAGIVIPGVGLLAAISVLAGQLEVSMYWLLVSATLGAIAGDGLSYWIGKFFQDRLNHIWPFKSHPHWIDDGQQFFHRYGGISIFFGRFIGPIRPIIPLVAGIMKMDGVSFLKWNVISALCWAPVYLLPGYILGEQLDIKWLTSWQGLLVLLFMSVIAVAITGYIKHIHKSTIKKPD